MKPATFVFACAAAGAITICSPSLAQEAPAYNATNGHLFAKNVPDYYQHQKLGKSADGGQNDSEWERPIKIVAGNPTFDTSKRGGWCRISAFLDAFYYWRKAGYTGMIPNAGVEANANWLDVSNAMTKLLATFSFRPDKAAADRNIKAAIKAAGHGEEKGVSKAGDNPKKGLVYVEYTWDGVNNRVVYPSSDGVAKFADKWGFTFTMNEHAGLRIYCGSSVTAHLLENGATDPAVWWDYHNVTLGGADLNNATIFFADPDCNKGDTKANAGWTNLKKYIAWDGAKDVIPVPTPGAGNPPADPAEYSLKYVTAKFAADGRTIDPNVNANERYKKVLLNKLEVIEPVRAAPAGGGAADGGTTTHTFDVTPGAVLAMDEFWIFPTVAVDTDMPVTFQTSDQPRQPRFWVTEGSGFTIDPFGNSRIGAVHVKLQSGPALGPDEVGTLTFSTVDAFDPMTQGYDILTHYPILGSPRSGLPSLFTKRAGEYFAVQAIGSLVVPDAPDVQKTPWDACAADFNLDGLVDGADLGILLGEWGSAPYAADLNGDGSVDAADLGVLLAQWGPCPSN